MSLSLFETISFMRFEVAKANTSRNQRKSCSKENIVCCFLVLLNWFYYNDSSVNAIVFPFQRVNLSTFFFRVHFCFHLWNIFFTSLNSDFKIRGWCFNFWESAFPYFWESQHVHVWVAWFVLKSKLRDVWNSVDVLVQSKIWQKKCRETYQFTRCASKFGQSFIKLWWMHQNLAKFCHVISKFDQTLKLPLQSLIKLWNCTFKVWSNFEIAPSKFDQTLKLHLQSLIKLWWNFDETLKAHLVNWYLSLHFFAKFCFEQEHPLNSKHPEA